MIFELEKQNYGKIFPLIESDNELSVFAVLDGIMEGKVYVNDREKPTAALIQTSECNLIAGNTDNTEFNKEIAGIIDFWDTLTPDTTKWRNIIPQIHEDKFIREYGRCRYILDVINNQEANNSLPDGYYLETANPAYLRDCEYENADELLEWVENWGNDESFLKYGAGVYLRNADTIVSWSISDCAYKDKIAIGIHTDENYRKRGFASIVIHQMIEQCRQKGYKQIEWLCVVGNRGSRAVAEKAGFCLHNQYTSFAPYAPIENLTDLSEEEWGQWAEYFEQASQTEKRLLPECIFTYVKANNPQKVRSLLEICPNKLEMEERLKGFISYLHTLGMASDFIEL